MKTKRTPFQELVYGQLKKIFDQRAKRYSYRWTGTLRAEWRIYTSWLTSVSIRQRVRLLCQLYGCPLEEWNDRGYHDHFSILIASQPRIITSPLAPELEWATDFLTQADYVEERKGDTELANRLRDLARVISE